MLPYLMNYMGHRHIKNTLYYFHFVPEFFYFLKSSTFPQLNFFKNLNSTRFGCLKIDQ